MRLNDVMREMYAKRVRSHERDFPVIIHLEDTTLVLLDGKRREEKPNRYRARYDLLKEISHLPLGLFIAEDDAERDALRGAVPPLDGLADDERRVQERIISAGLDPLHEELRFNLTRAAELRIKGMHEQCEEWAHALGKRWDDVHAVIATSHMARRESLPKSYFDWLLGDPERVHLSEGIENEADALEIFGTNMIDARIGEYFFGSAKHMHRDLLSPPVERILSELKPLGKGEG